MKIETYECDACHERYETGDAGWTLSGRLTDAFGTQYQICHPCFVKLVGKPEVAVEGR